MNLLIPMAGAGQRFLDAGYTTSKPLIAVDGKPMIIQSIDSLPKANRYFFVCRDFHIKDEIDTEIRKIYPESTFIPIEFLTEGQASTCILAKDYINNSEELMIGACDNGMIWDHRKFEELKRDADCLLWTFRSNGTVSDHPEQYGWAKVDKEGYVLEMSIKEPISSSPTKDHAVVGSFWFSKGSEFVTAVEEMVDADDRINGEFYVDKCIDYLINAGKQVKVFEVDYYICWGTPNDLSTWEYWLSFYNKYRQM